MVSLTKIISESSAFRRTNPPLSPHQKAIFDQLEAITSNLQTSIKELEHQHNAVQAIDNEPTKLTLTKITHSRYLKLIATHREYDLFPPELLNIINYIEKKAAQMTRWGRQIDMEEAFDRTIKKYVRDYVNLNQLPTIQKITVETNLIVMSAKQTIKTLMPVLKLSHDFNKSFSELKSSVDKLKTVRDNLLNAINLYSTIRPNINSQPQQIFDQLISDDIVIADQFHQFCLSSKNIIDRCHAFAKDLSSKEFYDSIIKRADEKFTAETRQTPLNNDSSSRQDTLTRSDLASTNLPTARIQESDTVTNDANRLDTYTHHDIRESQKCQDRSEYLELLGIPNTLIQDYAARLTDDEIVEFERIAEANKLSENFIALLLKDDPTIILSNSRFAREAAAFRNLMNEAYIADIKLTELSSLGELRVLLNRIKFEETDNKEATVLTLTEEQILERDVFSSLSALNKNEDPLLIQAATAILCYGFKWSGNLYASNHGRTISEESMFANAERGLSANTVNQIKHHFHKATRLLVNSGIITDSLGFHLNLTPNQGHSFNERSILLKKVIDFYRNRKIKFQ